MAERTALQDLQTRLAERLAAAGERRIGRAWLAVEAAGAGLLLPLTEAGEIAPFRGCVAVPHTRAWFLGVANLRGQLLGVVDLAAFLGLAPAPAGGGFIVALNPRLEAGCALRVDRLAGLRREDEVVAVDADAAPAASEAVALPAFAGARLRDVAEPRRAWREIRIAELARDPHFLDITARG